ncbi:hypothetical protein N7462_011295 [Penicillium macrosclerotiorum]|uniref:uncharacterized protein n=1 Tax=Penicillium macrosclerotiorum TaxID=303699 RepID=UPI0025466D6D|nr:uncharacterized protein N7462_011295 [Penicillium macrosclerotiorum]KAJ5666886.1 hypothetical protein N7462_011295 [Penicillium macrosclerotiorum]
MFRRTPRSATGAIKQHIRSQSKSRFVNSRFQSTSSNSGTSGSNPALVGGVAGGAVAFTAGYAWYYFSGAKTLVDSNKQVKEYVEQAKQRISEKAPEPKQAYAWLKSTVNRYAVFIPGARPYVDSAFNDLEKIRDEHAEEFDKVVKDAYYELSDVSSKGGFDTDTAFKTFHILQKYLDRLLEISGESVEDVLDNHPQLKEKIGGSFDQLKKLGDTYGPQAKEEVNKTWKQISDIIKKGASADSAEEIKNLIKNQKANIQKLGDEAWQKGLEESRQFLDKNPKVKSLVEDNAEALKKGNFQELWGLIKESASSGKTEDLEKFVKDKVNQASNVGFEDLDKWLKMIPGGSNIIPQIQSLQKVADEKGGEAKDVVKETFEEVQEVLKKRKEQIEKLAEEEKKE